MLGRAKLISFMLVVSLLFILSSSAFGAVEFPTKTITIICPHAAGGGTDAVSRALAKAAEPIFKQSVIVVNRPGAAGAVGMTEGYLQKPDGYTLTMATVELVLHPLMGTVPWTPDVFKPVMLINSDPSAVTVRVDSPWKTLKEFLEDARGRPSKIKVGVSSPGTIWHLGAVALSDKVGVEFNLIPYPGGAAPAVKDLLGVHVEAVTVSPAEVGAHVDAGKLRILAIMSRKRDEKYSEVPTLKELGYDVELATWRALVVPKDTPDSIVKILHDGFKKAMEDEKFIKFMKSAGLGMDYRSSSELAEMLKEQEKLFAPLLEKFGLLKKK